MEDFQAPDTTAAKDQLFEALAHGYRRRILRTLDAAGEPVSVSTLATELVATEPALADGGDATKAYEMTYTSLLHVHIPKLEAVGLVDLYDDTVALTADAESAPLARPLDRGLLYATTDDSRTVSSR